MSQKHINQSNESYCTDKKGCFLLYDSELLRSPEASLLSRDILKQADNYQLITSGGRGQAWFVELGEISAVYRKYMRGGLVARLNRQTYISLSHENTRSIKEWRLLQWMFKQGLPVPRPVAASICRYPFSYSPLYHAQILIERLPDVETLDYILSQQEIEDNVWQAVGQCIRRFHNAGVYHADLNANNILLNAQSTVYLIDFDKGELRDDQPENALWKEENLQRLKRSLVKQQSIHQQYYFNEDNWQQLLKAYAE
ncbi:MAG: 3-deoxy-D-manno-octulosonic acid kinase [endosymbiont of Galathealinum brachiosum]|uniref:3-deoxy-D-manno-octulosonic acid kinase n=1 Tax=endosymbiont of Galathealinum brachiosum TaxID=2200906 RepID=A0A370DB21_9GAMM|nr:MAG: 3-deoxy-D-manno-octulosonic acid kinase [endosymbiont of Galathealinum brachiosum]